MQEQKKQNSPTDPTPAKPHTTSAAAELSTDALEPAKSEKSAAQQFIDEANTLCSKARVGTAVAPNQTMKIQEITSWMQVPKILAELRAEGGSSIRLTFPAPAQGDTPEAKAAREEQRAIRSFLQQSNEKPLKQLFDELADKVGACAAFTQLKSNEAFKDVTAQSWIASLPIDTEVNASLSVADVVNASGIQSALSSDGKVESTSAFKDQLVSLVTESTSAKRSTIITVPSEEQEALKSVLSAWYANKPEPKPDISRVVVWVGVPTNSVDFKGTGAGMELCKTVSAIPLAEFLLDRPSTAQEDGEIVGDVDVSNTKEELPSSDTPALSSPAKKGFKGLFSRKKGTEEKKPQVQEPKGGLDEDPAPTPKKVNEAPGIVKNVWKYVTGFFAGKSKEIVLPQPLTEAAPEEQVDAGSKAVEKQQPPTSEASVVESEEQTSFPDSPMAEVQKSMDSAELSTQSANDSAQQVESNTAEGQEADSFSTDDGKIESSEAEKSDLQASIKDYNAQDVDTEIDISEDSEELLSNKGLDHEPSPSTEHDGVFGSRDGIEVGRSDSEDSNARVADVDSVMSEDDFALNDEPSPTEGQSGIINLRDDGKIGFSDPELSEVDDRVDESSIAELDTDNQVSESESDNESVLDDEISLSEEDKSMVLNSRVEIDDSELVEARELDQNDSLVSEKEHGAFAEQETKSEPKEELRVVQGEIVFGEPAEQKSSKIDFDKSTDDLVLEAKPKCIP